MHADFAVFRSVLYRQQAAANDLVEARSQSRRAVDRVSRHTSRGPPPGSRGRSRGRCRSHSSRSRSRSGSTGSRDGARGFSRDRARQGCTHQSRNGSLQRLRQQDEFEKPIPRPPTISTFIGYAKGEGRGRAESRSRRNENRSCSRPRQPSIVTRTSSRAASSTTTHTVPASVRSAFDGPLVLADVDPTDLTSTMVCPRFRKGLCSFGAQCAFAHPGVLDISSAMGSVVSQRERKQSKKQAKLAMNKRVADDEEKNIADRRKMEAIMKLEAQLQSEEPLWSQEPEALRSQETVNDSGISAAPSELLVTGSALPVALTEPFAGAFDDTASLASGTTGRTLRFEEAGTNIDAESVADTATTAAVDQQRRLYDLFSEEPWDVVLSESAVYQLQHAGRPQQKAVLQVLKTLASGRWPSAQRQELGAHGPLKLRRAQCGELDVLWGVDMQFSQERGSFVEVLQIWDIAASKEGDAAADAILHEWRQSRRSFQGLYDALKQQKLPKDSELRLPRVVAQSQLQDSDVFSVRKFFALDEQVLHSLMFESNPGSAAGASEQFTHRISKQEAAMVEKKGPVIVIGRSGSGKTLCCVYRMFAQHISYWKRSRQAGGAPLLPSVREGDGLSHLNQVFVTHSVSLANKVLEYFSNLQQSAGQAAGAAVDKKAMIGGSLVEQTRLPDSMKSFRAFPIFVTFRKLLIMIDGSCSTPFFPRRHTGAVHPDRVIMAESSDALDPIAALREQSRAAQRGRTLGKASGSGSHTSMTVLTEVDYDLFKTQFWSKVCQKVPSGCDASLVWREIQTFIKGSYKVLDSEKGFLDLNDYREVARKCSPGFEEHRSQIYDAFKTYQQLCKERNCFDRMDACLHVIRQLQREPYTGPPIHSVAVDEVQDLAQVELALFFLVMHKPYEELFITGDTSQTVSRAVDFRFCDLRSLFHYFGVLPPEIDQLVINYRSHQKILALSHLGVVRPLELAFPHAIDVLQPDMGHRDGPKPIVVTDVRLEDLARHLFNLGDDPSAGVAFGASQSILVRNEGSKRCLPPELSKALVLTVEQSKGLEFDDCIMVNFFQDSTYKDWQVMRNFQDELLGVKEGGLPRKRPHFERYRHTLLCSELKHLYTAMTRTKNVLLIIEQDLEQAQHTLELWNALGLVSFGLLEPGNLEAISQLISRAGASKGQESWRAMGFNLLRKQLFEQARSSFARAGDQVMVSTCEAYLLAQRAGKAMTESESEGMALYLEAAGLFGAADAKREQAECLLLGNRALEGAQIFEGLGDEHKHDAARAYSQAKKHQRAAELYEETGHYREALENLILADMMKEVKRLVLKAHEEHVLNGEECFHYLQDTESHDVAAELFFRDGDFERAAACFQTAGILEREAECYEKLEKPLWAADCFSTSNEPEHLRRAADLYLNLQQESKAAACYKSLLQMEDDSRDRPQLVRVCALLYDKLGDPASAAESWEQLGDLGDEAYTSFQRAAQSFQRAGCMKDLGRVHEKLAEFLEFESDKKVILHRAARAYEQAKSLEDALRVFDVLQNWDQCARLACALSDEQRAASYYHSAGDFKKEVQCLINAGEFEEARNLLPCLPEADPQLDIQCLAGLGDYDQAARLQMAVLHTATDDESRRKLALKAFEIAKKDKDKWKSFLAEFEYEMPDPTSALLYFVELGAVEELAQQLIKNQQGLVAVAAASVLGEPERAFEILMRVDLECDKVVLALEILGQAAQQNLGMEQLKALQPHCELLRQQITSNRENFAWEQLQLHYLTAVLHRRGGVEGKGSTNKKPNPAALQLHLSYKKMNTEMIQQAYRFQIEEEIAQSEGVRAVHPMAQQIRSHIREVAAGQRVDELLETCYLGKSLFHNILFDHLDACYKSTRRLSLLPVVESNMIVLPKCHVLCQHVDSSLIQPVIDFPGVVLLTDVKAAIQEDLASREVRLLIRLTELSMKDSVEASITFSIPGILLRACKENHTESRKANIKEAFVSSLKHCARRWAKEFKQKKESAIQWSRHMSGDVQAELLETSQEMWASAFRLAESVLVAANPVDAKFRQDTDLLKETLKDLFFMHLMFSQQSRWAIKAVAELVLKDLMYLMPVCPQQLQYKTCKFKNCTLDHPVVPTDRSPWLLLDLDTNVKNKFPGLKGIGLPGWIDLTSRCYNYVDPNLRCRRPEGCKWKHPSDEVVKALRKMKTQSSYYDTKKMDEHERSAQVFMKYQGSGARSIPEGFGHVFFENADLTRNVRLVALLACVLIKDCSSWVTFSDAREVLLRMCRAIYRFPEERAAKIARDVLSTLHHPKLIELSHTITWEVEGCPPPEEFSNRCLLTMLVGKAKPGQDKQMQDPTRRSYPVGASKSTFTWNRAAPVFTPGSVSILQRPQQNRWQEGNDAAALLFKEPAYNGRTWRPNNTHAQT